MFQSIVLVWIAISARGLFQAYIVETKDFAINSNTYVNECIIKNNFSEIARFVIIVLLVQLRL